MRDSRYPVRNGHAVSEHLIEASASWIRKSRHVYCAFCGMSGDKIKSDGTSLQCMGCQTISPVEM